MLAEHKQAVGKRTDQFNTEEILSVRNALWNLERHQALVSNKPVHGPLCPRTVAVFVDLEPIEASYISL